MTGAVFRAMWLGLRRDRPALVMTFVLPAVFFLIFATIFAGASADQVRLQVVVLDEVQSDASQRFLAALRDGGGLDVRDAASASVDDLRTQVRAGEADVGLRIRRDLVPRPGAPAPFVLVSDPVRAVSVPVLAGRIQETFLRTFPDRALGGIAALLDAQFLSLTAEQRARLDAGLDALAGRDDVAAFPPLWTEESVHADAGGTSQVAYYAGGIAFLFLLFASVHGAMSWLDERDAGVEERILAGPAPAAVLLRGKFLFLVVQGFVQVGVIFALAWLLYDVDLPGRLGLWAVTTLTASIAAAGFALATVLAFPTRRQVQAFSNVVILIASALGGSMVPRFFMPEWLQSVGWLTPNTWALEAYASIFWRSAPLSALWLPWGALLLAGIAGYAFAWHFARAAGTR